MRCARRSRSAISMRLSRHLQRRFRAPGLPARWSSRPIPPSASSRRRGRDSLRHRLGGIHQGWNAIRRQACRIVLVVGVEKMSEVTARGSATSDERQRSQGGRRDRGRFRRRLRRITQHISALRRQSEPSPASPQEPPERRRQPLAQIQKDLGYEFCRKSRRKTPSSPAR